MANKNVLDIKYLEDICTRPQTPKPCEGEGDIVYGLSRNSAALLAGNNESLPDQVIGNKSRPFPDEWSTICEFIFDPALVGVMCLGSGYNN